MSNNILQSDIDLYSNMLHDLTKEEKLKGPEGWGDIGAWGNEMTVADNIGRTAWHESRFNPEAIQETFTGGEGQGRGLFQFSWGTDKGAHTAIKRTINYFDKYSADSAPAWLHNISYPYDLSKLNEMQQIIIFIGDKAMRHGGSLSGDYDINPEKVTEDWLLRHWAGFDPDNPASYVNTGEPLINTIIKRINSHDESMETFEDAISGEYTGENMIDILTSYHSE